MVTYAMSDIHGCIEELRNQMEWVDLNGENRIAFLGDYIDYGDSSFQVLKYIWDLQNEYGEEKVKVLKGNHEQMECGENCRHGYDTICIEKETIYVTQ